MQSIHRSAIPLAISLSAIAGYIDALGFLHLGGFFVSFMSGNSTRLAIALATGNGTIIVLLAEIISLFVFGAMLGALLGHFAGRKRKPAVLSFISLLLLAAAALNEAGLAWASIDLLALAMGAENAIFQKDGEVVIGLTYMTGTLVKVGQKMASHILATERYTWLPYLFLWLGLISGGLVGAMVFAAIGLHGLWFAAVAALCLTAVSLKLPD